MKRWAYAGVALALVAALLLAAFRNRLWRNRRAHASPTC